MTITPACNTSREPCYRAVVRLPARPAFEINMVRSNEVPLLTVSAGAGYLGGQYEIGAISIRGP